MQGKKIYQEKLFNNFQLSNRIPKEIFYRRLLAVLDLTYLYELTKRYYGSSGQGRYMKKKRQSTVEPVLGTLT